MSNVNTDGLPPEMQARIADIIAGAKQKQVQAAEIQRQAAPLAEIPPQQVPLAAPAAPPVRQPNLMDHVIALRQEVADMRNELHATAQVVDACGQAVGSLYQMFQSQTQPTNFSTNFQAQEQVEEDY